MKLEVHLRIIEDDGKGGEECTVEDGFAVEHPEPCAPTMAMRAVLHANLDEFLDRLHRELSQGDDQARRKLILPSSHIVTPGRA